MRHLFALFFCFSPFFLVAQSENIPAVTLFSPYNTVHVHLYYLQPESFFPEHAAKTVYAPDLSASEKEQLAIDLKKIIDGKGYYIDLNQVPGSHNYVDSVSKKNIYYLTDKEPRIYLEQIDGKWYYSESTVAAIPELYREVFPWGTDVLSRILPAKVGNKKILGLLVWQWLGILIYIILGGIVFVFFKFITRQFILLMNKTRLKKAVFDIEKVMKVAVAASLFITFLFIDKLLPALQLSIKIQQFLIIAFNLATIVFAAMFALRIIDLLAVYFLKLADSTKSKLDDQLLPIVAKLLKGFVVLGTIIYSLKEIGVDIMAILAGLSVGALALALAAQDTVKNFIGSITILIDHPFEIDDYIIAGSMEGTVEEVGIRATRIRTPNQSLAYIPNGDLSNMPIDNWGLRVYRRWRPEFGLTYSTSAEKIEAFIAEIHKILEKHPQVLDDKTEVWLNSFGASSINVFVNVFFNVKSWSDDLRCKHEVLMSILRMAEEIGVDFAFPSQSLYIEQAPQKES